MMIIKILIIIAVIFALGLITLLGTKSNLLSDIEASIGAAEAEKLTGAEKMALVVDTVYVAIIPIAKLYFTKSRIQKIAQKVYNRMKDYYLAKKANDANN